jgi:hypothetical protein
MKTFTIENETNAITVYALALETEATPNSERFTSEDKLATLAAAWPTARLVEIWNSLPSETPVKKFKDRATAVSRIWKAIQSLGDAPVAVESESVAEDAAPASEPPEVAPVAEDPASETAPREAATREATEPAVDTPVAPQTPDAAPGPPREEQGHPGKENARRALYQRCRCTAGGSQEQPGNRDAQA